MSKKKDIENKQIKKIIAITVIMKFKAKYIKSKLEKYHLNIQRFIELLTLKLLSMLEIKYEHLNLFLINLQLVRKQIGG